MYEPSATMRGGFGLLSQQIEKFASEADIECSERGETHADNFETASFISVNGLMTKRGGNDGTDSQV